MKTLVEIFQEQGTTTDKWNVHPKYVHFYEEIFAPIRETTKSVLEIGICEGGSLRALKEYFPDATIYGLDIVDKFVQDASDLWISTHLVDAGNMIQLSQWARGKEFHLIIDDGSHIAADIDNAFYTLWPYLNPGGYYIIEDVGCVQARSILSHFGAWVRLQNIVDDQNDIESIMFRHDMIVFKKESNV